LDGVPTHMHCNKGIGEWSHLWVNLSLTDTTNLTRCACASLLHWGSSQGWCRVAFQKIQATRPRNILKVTNSHRRSRFLVPWEYEHGEGRREGATRNISKGCGSVVWGMWRFAIPKRTENNPKKWDRMNVQWKKPYTFAPVKNECCANRTGTEATLIAAQQMLSRSRASMRLEVAALEPISQVFRATNKMAFRKLTDCQHWLEWEENEGKNRC
jgi:hypothetical protein